MFKCPCQVTSPCLRCEEEMMQEYRSYDSVKNPKHYQGKNGLEAMSVIENFIFDLAGKAAYCWGDVIKYLLRFQQKNGVEDLNPALQCFLQDLYQLTDPQKVVIPKFMAEWIEYTRKKHLALRQAMSYYSRPDEVKEWLEYAVNQDTFARAWLDGYEVEQEKRYTVEVPNPNRKGNNRFYLHKDPNTGKILLCKGNFNPEKNKNLWLTESEIRKDFDWAWQAGFAKEVE